MSVLILLLMASLSVSVIFLGAFIWSTKNRQFDDTYSSSTRLLFDDQPPPAAGKAEAQTPLIHDHTYTKTEITSKQLN